MSRSFAGLLLSTLLATWVAGCATPEPPPAIPEPVPELPPRAEKPAKAARVESQPLRHLANRKLAPMPVKPLNVKAACSFRDPDGYGGKLDLLVQDSDVRRFQAEVKVPKRGNCALALKDFRQTATVPAVALAAEGGCTVHMWEEPGGRVTVGFNGCRDRCGESFDYVWPILVDARTGRCS